MLNQKNAVVYAAKIYDNPRCASVDEFLEDLRRVKYVKRLLRKYVATGEIKEQLVLNHVITLLNVFDPPRLIPLLFLKMDTSLFSALKTVLQFLNHMPEILVIDGLSIRNCDIQLDGRLWDRLQDL